MKSTFLSRFVGFTPAFYAGSIIAVFLLTIVKTATFFHIHFWMWLISWMQGDVIPVALAELFRSPIMGLIFAAFGNRALTRGSNIKWGFACGSFSYAVAYFCTVLSSFGGRLAAAVTSLNLTESFLLGLPVVLVIASRAFPPERQIT